MNLNSDTLSMSQVDKVIIKYSCYAIKAIYLFINLFASNMFIFDKILHYRFY